MPPIARDPVERFREKLVPEGECQLYIGSGNQNGYGRFYLGRIAGRKRYIGAHVYAYLLAFGPVPEGHEIHHICGVRSCCSPEHLIAKTRAEHNTETFGPRAKHCSRGHAMTSENTYEVTVRRCRKCHSERQSARDRKRRRAER